MERVIVTRRNMARFGKEIAKGGAYSYKGVQIDIINRPDSDYLAIRLSDPISNMRDRTMLRKNDDVAVRMNSFIFSNIEYYLSGRGQWTWR